MVLLVSPNLICFNIDKQNKICLIEVFEKENWKGINFALNCLYKL